MMEKQALLYGLGTQEAAVCAVLTGTGVNPRVIAPEQAGEQIGFLCGYKGYRARKNRKPQPAEDGALMLMDGLSPEELEDVLETLRQQGLAVGVLKATVTPTNRNWTLAALLEEVRLERETVQALMKLKKLLDTVPMPEITNMKLVSAMMQAQTLLSGTREVTVQEAEKAYRDLQQALA